MPRSLLQLKASAGKSFHNFNSLVSMIIFVITFDSHNNPWSWAVVLPYLIQIKKPRLKVCRDKYK